MAVRATLRECEGECECLCARTTAREQQGQEQRGRNYDSEYTRIQYYARHFISLFLLPYSTSGHHFAKGGIISTGEQRQL